MKTETAAHFPITGILISEPEKGIFVAESIDHCLAAQAESLIDLWEAFGHVFFGTILIGLERNWPIQMGKPFADVTNLWAVLSERSIEPDFRVAWVRFKPSWAPRAMGRLSSVYGIRDPQQGVPVRWKR